MPTVSSIDLTWILISFKCTFIFMQSKAVFTWNILEREFNWPNWLELYAKCVKLCQGMRTRRRDHWAMRTILPVRIDFLEDFLENINKINTPVKTICTPAIWIIIHETKLTFQLVILQVESLLLSWLRIHGLSTKWTGQFRVLRNS